MEARHDGEWGESRWNLIANKWPERLVLHLSTEVRLIRRRPADRALRDMCVWPERLVDRIVVETPVNPLHPKTTQDTPRHRSFAYRTERRDASRPIHRFHTADGLR